MSPLNKRRWRNFSNNKRAFYSLVVFTVLFVLSLFAEFLANDKPILVHYRGEYYTPVFNFYPETQFGGDFKTEAIYRDDEVKCLIISGGVIDCFDAPAEIMLEIENGTFSDPDFEKGWMVWPVIPYSYDTPNTLDGPAPSAPDANHWLGTDEGTRDVLARTIYGFRLSILFTIAVVSVASVIGIVAGAVQGFRRGG